MSSLEPDESSAGGGYDLLGARISLGLWGRTPTRESVLANHVDLNQYRDTFPTWTKELRKKMRKAAGVRPPKDPRVH